MGLLPRTASAKIARQLSPSSEWRAGWRPLLGGFLAMSTAWNVVSIALSVFLVPMQAEIHWSRTALSIAPFASLLSALLLPITGLLLDSFGARPVAIGGTTAMAAVFLLFAIAPATPIPFTFAVLLLAFAGATTNSFVLARGIASWFRKSLGTALGILLAGVSIGLSIIVPLLGRVVAGFGWRSGFIAFAAIAVLVSLPSLMLLFREPGGGQSARGAALLHRDSFRSILTQRRFWQLAAACFVAALPIGGVLNHLVPLLIDRGMPATTAAGLGSVFAISIGLGGLFNGWLFDRIHPPAVVAMTLLLAAVGAVMLRTLGMGQLGYHVALVAVALLGLAPGAEGDYITYFSSRMFGIGNFARVVSLMAVTISIGMAGGGLLFATAFDKVGNYAPAVIGSILLYLLAAGMFLTIPMPPLRDD